jgi:multicomponent Na+:H+ antiporter subunit F
MYTAAAFAILVAMVLSLFRAFAGPTLYDRILAVNVFGTKTVLLIAVVGFLMGRPEFLDIVMVYALMNFISVIGILRFFEYTAKTDAVQEK